MKLTSLGRTFEHAEVDAMARQAAAGLSALGVAEGDAVGLLMVNEVEVIALSQAVGLLGAYPVPIGWHNTADEVAYIAQDAALAVLVSHDAFAATAAAALDPGVPLVVVTMPQATARAMHVDRPAEPLARTHLDWEDWLEGQEPWSGAPRAARPAIVYTSGTTGKPKGVLRQAHGDASARAEQARFLRQVWGVEPGTRTLLVAPLYHSAPAAFVRAALDASPDSGELHFLPRFDAEAALREIHEHRITSMWMVPTMFVKLLQLPAEVRERYDVSSVENVVHSGAPCPVGVKLAMIEWFGPVVNEFYGSTETGPVTYATSDQYLARPGTVGRVMDGCSVAIVQADGTPAPAGVAGEIAAANPTYAAFTYHGRQDERDALDVAGHLLTGDIGVLDEDGYLFLKDRKKDMVISGGVNLYPAEVEDVLLQVANVRDGAAFGLDDDVFGERLVAAVSLLTDEPDAPARIEHELRARLSPTKVPKEIFVLDHVPRSEAGKVAKHELRDLVASR